MATRKWILMAACAFVALQVVSGCSFFARQERLGDLMVGRDYRFDPTKEYRAVPLATVAADPTGYKRVDVVFDAIFHRNENSWVAYYTHFIPEHYVSFSVWPEIRDVKSFTNDVPFLFMRKDNPCMDTLLAFQKYVPVRVWGTVAYDFNNVPWIEVIEIKSIGSPVATDRGIRNFILGLDAARERKTDLAVQHLRQALELKIPAVARATAEAELARIGQGDAQPVAETAKPVRNPVAELQEQVEKLNEELSRKGQEIEQSNALLVQAQKALETAVEEERRVNAEKSAAMTKEMDESKTKLQENEGKIKEFEERLVKAEGERGDSAKAMDALQAQHAALQTELQNSKELAAGLESQAGKLKAQTAEYEQRVADLEKTAGEKEPLVNEIAELKRKADETNAKYAEVEKLLASTGELNERSRKQIAEVNEHMSVLQKDLEAKQAAAEQEKASLAAEFEAKLRELVAQKDAEIAKAAGANDDRKMKGYEKRILSLQDELEALLREKEVENQNK